MTTMIKQLGGSDCVLASIAMAAGKEKWEDLWNENDLKAVDGVGVGDEEPWMERAGFKRCEHYIRVYVHGDQRVAKNLLWRRRALVSVNSLNNEHGGHMVYWDGKKIWDPSPKKTFDFLDSCYLTSAIIFND